MGVDDIRADGRGIQAGSVFTSVSGPVIQLALSMLGLSVCAHDDRAGLVCLYIHTRKE